MRKSSSNSLMNGVHNKQDMQELLNLASDQGFGLGGKIIQGFRFNGQVNTRNQSQYGESCLSELSEFGANRSMMSLSVQTGAQGSLG